MSETSGYTKSISWTFSAGREDWAITDIEPDYMMFEETSKNGQGDTHVQLPISLVDGKWVIEADDKDLYAMYLRDGALEAVEKHINKHGIPNA